MKVQDDASRSAQSTATGFDAMPFASETHCAELGILVDGVREAATDILESGAEPPEQLRQLVTCFGRGGLLQHVTTRELGGAADRVSTVTLSLLREALGRLAPIADLAFAMQGLGSYPMTHAHTSDRCEAAEHWLPKIARGEAVAAFALTERGAGSDLSGIATRAEPDGDEFVLTGEKVFISNAGIADVHVVFARTEGDDAKPSRRLSAFAVPLDLAGVTTEPWEVLGGHPIGAIRFDEVRLKREHLVGPRGRGLGLALATLSRFRTTVGAAAVGFAQRALDESIKHVSRRRQFGAPLAELDLVRAKLGDMECLIEGARLLVQKSAWLQDEGAPRELCGKWSSMAKLVATENAQKVVDAAVQLHGGSGVLRASHVARLYEDVRSLRIYEGASDIQRVLIARALLNEAESRD